MRGLPQPNDRWERNCEIVRLRGEGLTLRVLGQRYGLCHHRINQIVLSHQRKLRRREYEASLQEAKP